MGSFVLTFKVLSKVFLVAVLLYAVILALKNMTMLTNSIVRSPKENLTIYQYKYVKDYKKHEKKYILYWEPSKDEGGQENQNCVYSANHNLLNGSVEEFDALRFEYELVSIKTWSEILPLFS